MNAKVEFNNLRLFKEIKHFCVALVNVHNENITLIFCHDNDVSSFFPFLMILIDMNVRAVINARSVS